MRFLFDRQALAVRARPIVLRLPTLTGDAIRVELHPGLRDQRGVVHGGAFLRERRIALDCSAAEFNRIFAHEVFHFVWLRLGNSRRRSYEFLLKVEMGARSRGELGWSSEWRKRELQKMDVQRRTRRWREYCCESFCDSAAWLYSGVKRHDEFTLASRFRESRRRWFAELTAGRQLSI